jgi:hypothetical protein
VFYIYADGKLLNQPLEDSLIVMSPKLTLEMGKAGSLEFALPPNNAHYNALRKLKTLITVDLDETELFRGRVLSHDRNFNNVKKIFAEGDLAYLVDSVQKPEKFTGTTHELFRKIIAAHNAQMDAEKRFTVGNITVEDRSVVITGQSEEIEDLETGSFDYRQIAINSTSNDWPTSYDYIVSCLIEYCGGYLRTRRVGNTTYIDLVADYGNTATQDIELGTNILDLTEEATAEEVFTVLIPIGDENLTIASVNGGSEELVDSAAVDLYGRIVKTHVFENVNQASTLLENAQRFMANHENVPITFTIRAVDMHLVDPAVQEIHVGDRVRVRSAPHGVSGLFTCTRIEYDLENPANNTYTFGNPRQTLTQRYRKDKRKSDVDSATGGGSGGAGGAGGAAAEEAKEGLQELFDAWINVDPETAHIDLGTLYQKVLDQKTILEVKTGIDLDSVPLPGAPNVNIYSMRQAVDDIDGRVTQNSANIQLFADELRSEIDTRAAWSEEVDGQINAWDAQLTLTANALGEAIASLQTTHENRIAAVELKSTELEASALMKATYDANRTADLQLISDAESSIATLKAAHNGRLASLETRTSDLEASAVMKADYNGKIASIEIKANSLESSIAAQADAISLKASRASLNAAITTINDRIKIVEDDISGIDELIANKISAADIDVSKLTSKTLRVVGLTADNLYANNYVSAPAIRMGGKTVATESYVNDAVANLVTPSWVTEQGFATKSYVDGRNAWGSSSETGKYWCTVGGASKLVALGNHSHSGYCTEARVNELIAAATIPWSRISGKPSSYYPSSHRHSFSASVANGHTHKVTVNGSTYTTQGVSVNATHSISGNTGYTGG